MSEIVHDDKKIESNSEVNMFKKHADTIAILATIIGSLIWMNGKFNSLEKDIAIIKTVMVMKNIMPSEMCKTESSK